MPTYSLLAANCPLPTTWSGVVDPSATAAYGAKSLANGDIAAVLTKVNENATRLDLLGGFGGGAYGVLTGLDLSAGAGLTLNYAAGQALISTLVTKSASTYSLPDLSGSRGYVWLSRDGVISHTTTVTPPAGAQLFIGSFVTNAGAIVSLDQSGIMYLKGGLPQRTTADVTTPTDTPPANLWHLVQGTVRLWLWSGSSYCELGCSTGGALSGQLTKSITGNTTLSAAEVANGSIRITDGGGLADGWVVTWPAASVALGDRWAVRNDSGKAGRLTLSSGSDYIYLNDDDQCIIEYSDGDLQELGTNHIRWKAVTVAGTLTKTQWEQLEAGNLNLTPSGTAILEYPAAGALENRGRLQVLWNANTGVVPVTVRKTGVTEDNHQTRILPGEAVSVFVQNDGAVVRANTRPYTTVKGVTHDDAASYTATDMEALGFILQVTGTLTASRNFVLPAVRDKLWLVVNDTSGGQSITVKTPSGAGVVIPNGSRVWCYSDGTDIKRGSSGSLAFGGDVIAMATTSASGTVANTTTEGTLFGTIVGNAQIPAGILQPGRSVRVKVRGLLSTAAVPGTLDVKFKLGSTQIVATGAQTPTASLTTRYFEVDVLLTCRTTGATGTVIAQGLMTHMPAAQSAAAVLWELQNTATVTIDTTAAQTIDVTADWGTADAANSIVGTNVSIELLN
jgi:hypothetical protein